MSIKLSRLWQPRSPMFWQLLFFHAMSSLCSLAMRALPLNTLGLLLLAGLALLNVAFGLMLAWRLVRDEPRNFKADT